MAALARNINIQEIEEDPTLVEGFTKVCFGCDIDNPKAVAKLMRKLGLGERPANFQEMLRNSCTTCGGTGQQNLAAAEIAAELKSSKQGEVIGDEVGRRRNKKTTPRDEDDIYLEY